MDLEGESALSLGERVASVASQVRGYWHSLAHLMPPRVASDPSPGPRRLVKTPAAGHPLPKGEGCFFDSNLPEGHPCRFRPPEQLPIVFSGTCKRAGGLVWTCFKPRKSQRSKKRTGDWRLNS
jgi:hypothetical protein